MSNPAKSTVMIGGKVIAFNPDPLADDKKIGKTMIEYIRSARVAGKINIPASEIATALSLPPSRVTAILAMLHGRNVAAK